MAILTQRQRDILLYLLKQGESTYAQVATIAAIENVGERSVRNDLHHIESHVSASGLHIERRQGQGIRLVGPAERKQALRQEVSGLLSISLTPEQRISVAIATLLLNEVCTYQEIADACLVSRQTVVSLFPQIERALHNERLGVEKMQGTGLSLSGSELAFRHCFLQFVISNPSPDVTHQTLARTPGFTRHEPEAARLAAKVESHFGAQFIDKQALVLSLAYMLERIEDGHVLEESELDNGSASADAIELATFLSDDIPFPPERTWASSVLLSQRMGWDGNAPATTKQIDDEAQEMSHELIKALRKMHDIDTVSTQHLVDSLTAHLRAAIHRARNSIQIGNDHAQQIRVSVPLLYEFTRQQMAEIGPRFNLSFSDGEVAYIAMYLASIFETSEQHATTLKILLACSFGVATSTILKARIARMLPDCTLMGPVPVSEATAYLASHVVDLVISTVAIPNAQAPVLVVNPMLGQRDIDHIKDSLYQSSYSKLCSHFLSLYSATGASSRDIHNVSDYVCLEDIMVIDTCPSWQDAIRLAARPLVEKGFLEPRYVEAMVNAVTDFGTYMVLTPETAYVHAGIDDGIWRDCAAVLALRSPIPFGLLNQKSIRTIVVLGIRDKERSDLLYLASIFDRQENRARLRDPGLEPGVIWHMHD